jgi:hypothetical protein
MYDMKYETKVPFVILNETIGDKTYKELNHKGYLRGKKNNV